MPLVNASVLGAIPPVGCLPRIENPVFFRNRSFPGGRERSRQHQNVPSRSTYSAGIFVDSSLPSAEMTQ